MSFLLRRVFLQHDPFLGPLNRHEVLCFKAGSRGQWQGGAGADVSVETDRWELNEGVDWRTKTKTMIPRLYDGPPGQLAKVDVGITIRSSQRPQ